MNIENINSYEDYEELKKKVQLYPVFKHFSEIPKEFVGWCIMPTEFDESIQITFITDKQYTSDPTQHHLPNYYVMSSNLNATEYCAFHKNGVWHNLNGPARRWANNIVKCYLIDNQSYEEQDYWKHPLVAINVLNNILKVLEQGC